MTEIRQVILAICGEIVPYLTERKGEVVLFHSFYKMHEQKFLCLLGPLFCTFIAMIGSLIA